MFSHHFNELSKAVKAHKKAHIQALIKEEKNNASSKSLFTEVDENNNTALHLAAQYCVEEDARIVIMIIVYLKAINALNIACTFNTNGQSPLHIAVEFNSLVVIGEIIKAMGNQVNKIARTYDNNCRLPIMTLFANKTAIPKKMILPLLDATFYNPFELGMLAKIDSNTIINNYQNHSRALKKNLKLACEVANKVRDIIVTSASHPDNNNASLDDKIDICRLVDHVRKDVQGSMKQISAILKHRAGNCSEFVVMGLYIIRNKPNTPKAEYFYLQSNTEDKHHTHAFMVLDRISNSDPADYTTWGANAVVCDSWAGKVYPAFEVPTHMACHFSLGIDPTVGALNIIGLYNQKCHVICRLDEVLEEVEEARCQLL